MAALVAGTEPITREAVASLRDAARMVAPAADKPAPTPPRPDKMAQALARATGLCDRLDAALQRLNRSGGIDALPHDQVLALRQRVAELAARLTLKPHPSVPRQAMGKPQRDRVTIDLRGLREPLQTRARVNQMTPAALVRQAVLAYLAPKSGDQKPDPKPLKYVREEQVVKVTLRLPAGHAALMNFQARIAECLEEHLCGRAHRRRSAAQEPRPDRGRAAGLHQPAGRHQHRPQRLSAHLAHGQARCVAGAGPLSGRHRYAEQRHRAPPKHGSRTCGRASGNPASQMTTGPSIDGVLVEWGERLFYPASRIVKPDPRRA